MSARAAPEGSRGGFRAGAAAGEMTSGARAFLPGFSPRGFWALAIWGGGFDGEDDFGVEGFVAGLLAAGLLAFDDLARELVELEQRLVAEFHDQPPLLLLGFGAAQFRPVALGEEGEVDAGGAGVVAVL